MIDGQAVRQSWRAWLSGEGRRGSSWWSGYVWTLVFATACALGFTIVNVAINVRSGTTHQPTWWLWFQANMVVSLCITVSIRLLFTASAKVIGEDRLRGWNKRRRSLYFGIVPIVGVSIGWPLGVLWGFGIDVRSYLSFDSPGPLIATVALAVLVTLMFHQFFAIKTRQIQAENRATEAQLRLLQAQIEPHFLFNTLANVVSLIDTDTPRAKLMLESFVDYLRASLAGLGQGSHTLGHEIDLVEAYMRIVQIRMEDRLRYSVDVPEALRARPLPALTLQPLVENAIVHGLEPRIEGGSVRIAARLERGALVLTVEDDGEGLGSARAVVNTVPIGDGPAQASGSGVALANIRERLRQAYGGSAALRLDAVQPHGVRASLSLPASA